MLFDKTIQNISRLTEITRILWKYGFEEFITVTRLSSVIPDKARLSWRREQHLKQYNHWQLMRMAVEELGPTFIKFGQLLSNRPDIIPAELIAELKLLQSEVESFPVKKAKELLRESLQQPIENVFSYFDETVLGAASIGQVHQATLLDGTSVVVKIRRPEVAKKVRTDLSMLKEIAKRAQQFLEQQGVLNMLEIIDAFDKSLQKELDFRIEARYTIQFSNYYKKEKDFRVPKVYKEWGSETVMVSEYVAGCKVTDIEQLKAWGLSAEDLVERGMKLYLSQIFEHGYFHADPHPGNIIIEPNGNICLIDFGMVGRISKSDKFAFAGILTSMAQQNARKMADSFKRLAVDTEIENEKAFQNDLQELIDEFAHLDIEDLNASELAHRLHLIVKTHHIQIPGSIFLILRALTILEGIGKDVHPSFNVFDFLKPYGIKLVKQQYAPKNIAEEIYETVSQFKNLFQTSPAELRHILNKLRRGKLHLVVDHTGYENGVSNLSKALNRLALSIAILGIYLASSILALAKIEGLIQYYGLPLLSIFGFTIATLLLCSLLYGVFKK